MAAQLEVIRTTDSERWTAVLSEIGTYDFYHLAVYHEMAERGGGGEGQLLVYRQGTYVIALPLMIRRCDTITGLEDVPSLDATSVYGYAGPVSSDPNPPGPVIADFQSSVRESLESVGVVTLFTSLHPLIPQRSLVAGLGEVSPNGSTVSVDLTMPEEDQVALFRSNHVRDIRKLRALGATCIRETTGSLAEFVPIYYETMLRLGAAPSYYFDEQYFARLASLLGSQVELFSCVLDGEVIAGGLFLICGDIVQYHLGGTRTGHAHQGALKLVLDTARRWATQAGMRVLHLGGGLGAQEDSLFHFKAGFSSRRHEYLTWRWVLDRETYDRITAKKVEWNTSHGEAFASLDHFPLYRGRTTLVRDQPVSIEFRRIRPADAILLGQLLPRIESTHFRPHPMTAEEAQRIAALTGRDVYLLGLVDGEALVYGMLRGWDEGYPVASLGIGVRQDSQRRGFGRAMMQALHHVALEEGATRLRLRVHPDNLGAAALYRSLGYRARGMDRGEILMVTDLLPTDLGVSSRSTWRGLSAAFGRHSRTLPRVGQHLPSSGMAARPRLQTRRS